MSPWVCVWQVPSVLTHALFWQRYFYKVHLLAQEEALRNALMERTQEAENDTQWDEEGSSTQRTCVAANRRLM